MLVAFGAGKFFAVASCPAHHRIVSSIPVLDMLHASGEPLLGHNPKCVQTLPDVPWGQCLLHLRTTDLTQLTSISCGSSYKASLSPVRVRPSFTPLEPRSQRGPTGLYCTGISPGPIQASGSDLFPPHLEQKIPAASIFIESFLFLSPT